MPRKAKANELLAFAVASHCSNVQSPTQAFELPQTLPWVQCWMPSLQPSWKTYDDSKTYEVDDDINNTKDSNSTKQYSVKLYTVQTL